ncbi:hypothetical protein V1503_19335 [Bacillus sp. SCS-151]|uniref:hypothetical protein n=1 Tax=Nanhaiella sioensis TaxID=3115293 RepID=UPI00397DAB2A
MESLRLKVIFKSGREIQLKSKEHSKGELRQWINRNLINSDGSGYGFVTFDDIFININEIEMVQEIK